MVPTDTVTVEEYFRGKIQRSTTFETMDEALDFVSRQGDEPGVEWRYLREA